MEIDLKISSARSNYSYISTRDISLSSASKKPIRALKMRESKTIASRHDRTVQRPSRVQYDLTLKKLCPRTTYHLLFHRMIHTIRTAANSLNSPEPRRCLYVPELLLYTEPVSLPNGMVPTCFESLVLYSWFLKFIHA